MNRKELLLSLFLTVIVCSATFGQAKVIEQKYPVRLQELLDFFRPPTIGSDTTILEANNRVLAFLAERCDIGFVDDGTNYWALRTAGATDEIMREVDRCTTPAIRSRNNTDRKFLTEAQIHLKERVVISELVRLLWPGKDINARKRSIVAAQEYVKRYRTDDRYSDPGTDELLQYLIIQVPKMEQRVSTMKL